MSFLCGGACDCDADGAFCFGDLDGCDAYAAACSGDEDEVTFGEMAEHDEAAVCGEVLHPDGGAFYEREIGGVFGDGGDGDDGNFAVDTVGVEVKETRDRAGGLADPTEIDAGSNGFDDA